MKQDKVYGEHKHFEYLDYAMTNRRVNIYDLPGLLARQFSLKLRMAEAIVDEWAYNLRQQGVD